MSVPMPKRLIYSVHLGRLRDCPPPLHDWVVGLGVGVYLYFAFPKGSGRLGWVEACWI